MFTGLKQSVGSVFGAPRSQPASKQNHAEACSRVQEALAVKPDNLGGIMDMYTLADEAIALDPGYASAHAVRALAFVHAGKFDLAKKANRQATKLDPGCKLAQRVQMQIHDKQKLSPAG